MTDRNSLFATIVALTVTAACDRPGGPGPTGSPVPTAVACADAPRLRQRAAEEQLQVAETTSDQTRIVGASRASFYVSLAIVADLKCRVASADADTALSAALAAARSAEAAGTFYETAVRWTEAGVAASQAVSALIGQLPAPPE